MKKLLMAMILGALALTSCAGGGEPAPETKEQVPETAAQEAMKIDTYTTWKDITAYFHPETKLTEDEEKLQSGIKLFQVIGLANGSESREITHDSWGAIVNAFYPDFAADLAEEDMKRLEELPYGEDPYGVVVRGLARGEKDVKPLAVTTTTTGAEVLQAVDPEAYAAMSEEEKSALGKTTVLDGFGWASQRFEFKPTK